MSGERPTILDVAARSGVSKSTVSNVIRGSSGVSADARRRVLAAVAELGYRPNAVARQLVQRGFDVRLARAERAIDGDHGVDSLAVPLFARSMAGSLDRACDS